MFYATSLYIFICLPSLGEREDVDHLVFVVPGIEDMFNNKGKSVEALGKFFFLYIWIQLKVH